MISVSLPDANCSEEQSSVTCPLPFEQPWIATGGHPQKQVTKTNQTRWSGDMGTFRRVKQVALKLWAPLQYIGASERWYIFIIAHCCYHNIPKGIAAFIITFIPDACARKNWIPKNHLKSTCIVCLIVFFAKLHFISTMWYLRPYKPYNGNLSRWIFWADPCHFFSTSRAV